MKNSLFALLSAGAALSLVMAWAPVVSAQDPVVQTVPTQTTTTTTVTPDQTKTTETTVTTVPAQPVPVQPVAVQPAPVAVQPGQHVAELEVVLTHGTAEAYFGSAPRGEKFALGSAEIRVKLPSTATVTKLASRDKNSDGARRITVDNPWHVTVPFNGPGRYVFNVVEWDDDATAAVVLVKVDGVVKFEGHGHDDDFSNWPAKTYGEGVHRTGSREIAFDVE